MPRITGPTLAEHVATQKANVVSAARALFSEHGVAAVSLADIAAEVGLGRTALYRYFPTKAHILMTWFDQEMDILLTRTGEALAAGDPAGEAPGDGLRRWLDVQLDFLTDSEHRALSEATATAGELPPDVAAHFGERHRELYATLEPLLEPSTPDPVLRRHRTLLVAGLIRSSADSLDRGTPERTVREELHRSALAVAGC